MKRESRVSTPLMTGLRKSLADLDAEVIKHYDASMIGCPDCSITIGSVHLTLWLEFKLWIPPKKWDGKTVPYKAIAATEKGVQLATCKRLRALYCVWVNKSKHVSLWDPNSGEIVTVMRSTKEMVAFLTGLIRWYHGQIKAANDTTA